MAKVQGLDSVGRVGIKDDYAAKLKQLAAEGYNNPSVVGETGTAAIEAANPDWNKNRPVGGSGSGGGGAAAVDTSYKAATLPSATSQEAYINAMYDANVQKQKAALEAQYAANVGALDQQAAKIPGQYDAAANQAAAQAAILGP